MTDLPELPEVETIVRTLAPRLLGKGIEGVEVFWDRAVHGLSPQELEHRLRGRVIGGLSRRGKFLLLELADGNGLAFHLRMTGRLVLAEAGSPREKHTRLAFLLSSHEELRFVDIRKFGGVQYLDRAGCLPRGLAELGPEPLGAGFTPDVLAGRLAGRRRPLKGALLDQRLIAGIGNIYADEALHRAGLLPTRPAGSLGGEEVLRLHGAIREVLAEGIEHRGTTVRNYVDGNGRPGGFQERLRVYGQAGLSCRRCGGTVERIVVCGRGTYYCPGCQM